MEKVPHFDRKTLRGVHHLFRGCISLFGGAHSKGVQSERQVIPENWTSSFQKLLDLLFVIRIDQHDPLPGAQIPIDTALVIFLQIGNCTI